jgi:uncharacterized phiE125 gp8 family phage protein
MRVKLVTPPAVEPCSLAEFKLQLNNDSGTIADNSTLYNSIASGSHPVVVAYTLLGTAIDVLGHNTVVYLNPVNNGTGGTVDVKIQECDTSTGTFTDWLTGAFTQVTEANDTVIQEKAYTGTKQWIRTVAKTLVAACEFGTTIMVWEPVSTEDSMLLEDLKTSRRDVENDTGRKIITQTWDYYPSRWPDSRDYENDRIKIPYGNLQSVTSVKWKDTAGTETTLVENTDYLVELNGTECGYIVLPYQESWPDTELYPSNPITIRFVCGYGLAADVPENVKRAIKSRAVNYYMNRGDDVVGYNTTNYDITYSRLCNAIGRLHDMDFL